MRYNPERITPEVIAKEINGLGFQAVYIPEASSGKGSILEFTVNSKVSSYTKHGCDSHKGFETHTQSWSLATRSLFSVFDTMINFVLHG